MDRAAGEPVAPVQGAGCASGQGQQVQCQARGHHLRLIRGQGLQLLIQEITQRKLAEQKLKDQRVHLERLFHSSPEAIALCDPQGRVTRINQGFTRLFGYSEDEALDQDIIDLIGPGAGCCDGGPRIGPTAA